MDAITLLVAMLVFLFAFIWLRRPDPRLPPSPRRPLPLVGHLFYMQSDYRPLFREWRKKCGDIYSLQMGSTSLVVLNGYDIIKEALVKKADACSDRPPLFIDEATGHPQKGVIFSNGENWREQRSVTLSILRDFGMGKNILAEKIQEEVRRYMDYLASLDGKPTNIRVVTYISVSNVICSILIGHRFEHNDTYFQDLMRKIDAITSNQLIVGLVNFIPWIKYIPGDFFRVKAAARNIEDIIKMLAKFKDELRQPGEDPISVNNFIDAYVAGRTKKRQAEMPTLMDDENLFKIMFDLFLAGTETTSTTIYWCVLYMLNYPDVQEKVYREIKDKVGTDRIPTIQDKAKLTYLNAVILETQRLASIAPLAVTHMVSEDVTLRGYTLPKGTCLILNLDSVLHDAAIWGDDVMDFNPDRFIDDKGKLKNPEQMIPFGTGRRACVGEGIAKMELFLIMVAMIQRFKFLPPTPGSIPTLDYVCGSVASPNPYQVRVVERD